MPVYSEEYEIGVGHLCPVTGRTCAWNLQRAGGSEDRRGEEVQRERRTRLYREVGCIWTQALGQRGESETAGVY